MNKRERGPLQKVYASFFAKLAWFPSVVAGPAGRVAGRWARTVGFGGSRMRLQFVRSGLEAEITRMARPAEEAERGTSRRARNSRRRHYSVPPAILLAAATYWPRQHSFPARSANRCISPPIPICHCPRGLAFPLLVERGSR